MSLQTRFFLQIQKSNSFIRKYLESADRKLQRGSASFDDLSKHAVECTYNVIEQLGRDVEEVVRTVSNCKNKLIKP